MSWQDDIEGQKVYGGYYEYQIAILDSYPGDEDWAYADYDCRFIKIQRQAPVHLARSLLFHEYSHHLLNEMGEDELRSNERFVRNLAGQLEAFCTKNLPLLRKVAKWGQKKPKSKKEPKNEARKKRSE